jgi:hypothetical protein
MARNKTNKRNILFTKQQVILLKKHIVIWILIFSHRSGYKRWL